jgi:outer membrane protein TolC
VEPSATELVTVPDELMRASANGITSDQVGRRAAETSYSAKASDETLRAAAARVDTAWAAFLPRLTGTARYTRYSPYTQPSSFPFAPILDNYLLQANITVPITDYFLKINQAYTAATRVEDAARFDAAAARAKSGSEGRVAYYTWMRARGAVVVAVQALNDQRTHLNDARNQFGTGGVSKADVLRAETAVAAAELAVERAKNLAALTERQVRVAMHAPAAERLVPGESLEAAPAPFQGNLDQLTNEALASRLEVKSIEANADAARKQSRAVGAARFPAVSAFGDAFYVNPNPRSIPPQAEWYPAYDLGLQAIWSPNDVLTAGGQAGDAEHRAAALDAQAQVTRDGIAVEVMDTFQKVREADFAFESTRRELASATEAYRVAHDLFNAGRGTSTTLTDAEGELTRARLDELNARVDARIARVRLEHALGRDTRVGAAR